MTDMDRLQGGGPARQRGGGAEPLLAGRRASPPSPMVFVAAGAARRAPAQQGWAPSGNAAGEGAQPPLYPAQLVREALGEPVPRLERAEPRAAVGVSSHD